jgi:Zn-dependent peptidase ImmA (M78 family)
MPRVEQEADRVRLAAGALDLPVDVELVARHLSIPVLYEPFQGEKNDISGILYRDADRTVIGVNSANTWTRQRFTIAHEIGHYLLHKGQRGLHVDRTVYLQFRDERSATAVDRDEIQANAFAAELLMPRSALTSDLLRAHAERSNTEDEFIDQLAKTFGVSRQAMNYRLVNVGILSPR